MTAGTRPSRRTERAAPLPVPLRVTAASCLIAAMMMSLFAIECARLASRGVGTGAKPALIEKRGREGKSGGSSLLSPARRRIAFLGRTERWRAFGDERRISRGGRRARRCAGAGQAFVGRADRTLAAEFHHW